MMVSAPQSHLYLTKILVLTLLLLLATPAVSSAQYLLDTFQDDVVNNPPNGPEIGSGTYSGGPVAGYSHFVTNWGGGDYRLRSNDTSASTSLSISYIPLFTSNIMQVDFKMRVEGNSILSAANAFLQSLNFSTISSTLTVWLYWGNDLELRIRTYSSFHDIDKTIALDYNWALDTDYQVSVFLDLTSDRYWVHIPGMGINYKLETFGVDVTKLNSFYFSTNYATTGSQVIDNVVIRKGYYGAPQIWYVDDTAAGANNGQSWTDAFRYLQDALTVAEPDDQIWVARGYYRPDRGAGLPLNNREVAFRLRNDLPLYGGFDGTEAGLDERDWHANETILTGDIGVVGNNSDNSYHVVLSENKNATAILDGFTVTRGKANGGYPLNRGGGMYIVGGGPTVNNCLFTENNADSGGGLYASGAGNPNLFNCIFLHNTAIGAGGALTAQQSNPNVRACMFLGNTAESAGGIFFLNNFDTPLLENCVFSGNQATASNGGAIWNAGVGISPNPFPPLITNCTFNLNATGNIGGGIYNSNGNDAVLNSCILWDNTDNNGNGETSQFHPSGTPAIRYSCLRGWSGAWGGPGNIGGNPLFVLPLGIDGILGNRDDNLRLMALSPCIDTGDPNPLLNDADGTRNDMGAYGGPGAEIGGVGVMPGSGFLFTDVGNIPRSEITMNSINPDRLIGTANVFGVGLGIPTYVNTAFGSALWLHGLFGADNMDDVDYYQVLVGYWDGGTPPNPANPADWVTLDDKLVKVRWFYTTEWEYEYVTIGPHAIGGVEDLYLLTPTSTDDMWSRLTVRIIWNTSNFPDGIYTVTIKAFDENPAGVITDITASLGDVSAGNLILHIDNSPVTSIIHSVNYDPANPYYIPIVDGEIQECSIINLGSNDENLRFFLTASHPHGFLRQFTLDNISGKNHNGGVIAQQVYPGTPPALWNGVTNTEFESKDAPNPPGNLELWRRCAYQFRLLVWPRITDGFGYWGPTSFEDHYFIDLPGVLDCSLYDIDNNGVINLIDFAAFAHFYLQSCVIE